MSTNQLFFVSFLESFSTVYTVSLQEQCRNYISIIVIYYMWWVSFQKDLCNVSKHVFQYFPYLFSPRHDHYKKPDTPFSSQYQLLMSCTVIRSFTKKKISLPKYIQFWLRIWLCYRGSIKLRKIEVKCKPMKGSVSLDIIHFFDIN